MEILHIVREKALRLGVRTGRAPDLDFVWQWQRLDGCHACFGCFHKASCSSRCRWYGECKAISEESLDSPWPIEQRAMEFGDDLSPID